MTVSRDLTKRLQAIADSLKTTAEPSSEYEHIKLDIDLSQVDRYSFRQLAESIRRWVKANKGKPYPAYFDDVIDQLHRYEQHESLNINVWG